MWVIDIFLWTNYDIWVKEPSYWSEWKDPDEISHTDNNDCFSILALGMGLCVAFIALVRLPSLKVSTLLLVGLLVYDVFWVSLCSF